MLYYQATQNPLFPLQHLQSLANKSAIQNKLIFLRQIIIIGDCCDTQTEQTYNLHRRLILIQVALIGFTM